MKTIEEFIKEINDSETLQGELKAIKDKNDLAELLKKNDVSATAEEFARTLKAMKEGEISDEDAEAAAGGGWLTDIVDIAVSVLPKIF